MNNTKKFLKIILILISVTFLCLLTLFSDVCKSGAGRGILICGNVIIPSLFPFMVCISLIIKTAESGSTHFSVKRQEYFEIFKIMCLSMLGGYPIGAKLINDLYAQKRINLKTANIMQMYCVNAGPAFIISAVGNGIFNSVYVGITLFFSHIIPSFLIELCTLKFINTKFEKTYQNQHLTFSENFVTSTAESASSVMKICTFVLIFSIINSYIEYFSKQLPILKNIVYFTEVTSAITNTKNIVFVSFLLGFAGISVWFQVFSISDKAKINLKLFIIGRLLHGVMSSILTFIIIKIFKLKIRVFSGGSIDRCTYFYDDILLAISLGVMLTVFFIWLYSKKYGGKIIEDVL